MKYLHILLLVLLTNSVYAQNDPLLATVWRLENKGEDGELLFAKIKSKDFQKQAEPFVGLRFVENSGFVSGNKCKGERGTYKLLDSDLIQFAVNDMYDAQNCELNISLRGLFQIDIDENILTLTPNNDNEIERDEPEFVDEPEESIERNVVEDAPEDVQEEHSVAVAESKVEKYQKFKTWMRDNFSSYFFQKLKLDTNVDVVLELWVEENGKMILKNIQGTNNENLIAEITSRVAKMPYWTRDEVDFEKTIKVPLKYKMN